MTHCGLIRPLVLSPANKHGLKPVTYAQARVTENDTNPELEVAVSSLYACSTTDNRAPTASGHSPLRHPARRGTGTARPLHELTKMTNLAPPSLESYFESQHTVFLLISSALYFANFHHQFPVTKPTTHSSLKELYNAPSQHPLHHDRRPRRPRHELLRLADQ